MWTSTSGYRDYANINSTPVRIYGPAGSIPIDPELNFPPANSYANRALKAYAAETQRIDVQMYRITDRRHSDAMIAAVNRHVAVRLYTDINEYRNPERLWHAWNVDRMWLAGIPIKVPAHQGINHQKTVLAYSQGLTIFGSSNWTSPSDDWQAEHNYFTKKTYFFDWFKAQFERKWNNTVAEETTAFVPLPPDKPIYLTPANGAVGQPTTNLQLVWKGGLWAHIYDIYFGTSLGADGNPPLFLADQPLGPTEYDTSAYYQRVTLPTLAPGTTYYWKIVSKTMALMTRAGSVSSFTTTGNAPPPPPSTLPSGWQTLDVGFVNQTGSAAYDSVGRRYLGCLGFVPLRVSASLR
jgi:PLD-like domain